MVKRIIGAALALTTFLIPLTSHAMEIKISDLPFIEYTHGSLANPHVIRIGEPQARGGRVAALERVYDVAGAKTRMQTDLKSAEKLFKKYGEDIPDVELIALMTAERTLVASRKFKQRLHVWDAQRPKKNFTVDLTPIFDEQIPEIVNPDWVLESNRIVLSQQSADGVTTKFYTIDLNTKKLRAAPQIDELPTVYTTDSEFDYTENGEHIVHHTILESNDDGSFTNERFTITNLRSGVESSVVYPVDEFISDDTGVTEKLNPLILELGNAGYYLKGYTSGAFLTRQGAMSPTNVMDNKVPESSSLSAIRAEISRKWSAVGDLDFATYQLVAYKLHK